MKRAIVIGLMISALAGPALCEDGPREAYKAADSLDAAPAATRGSLYTQRSQVSDEVTTTADGAPVSHSMSYIEVAAPPKKTYKAHDIVTIVISEDSESSTTGQAETKKTDDFNTAISQFIKLGSTNAGVPSVQQQGNASSLPTVAFNYANDRKNDATQGRKDSFTGRIAATVVDVKPNGTLVLEATKQIQNDKEVQLFRLTGVCKVESIKGDSVISTEIAQLSLTKSTKGDVRDGTKRGWFNSIWDKVDPF